MANVPHFEVYPRKGNAGALEGVPTEYGWRFRAANGQITVIGGEGFTRIEDAERAVWDTLDDMLRIVPEMGELPLEHVALVPILRVGE